MDGPSGGDILNVLTLYCIWYFLINKVNTCLGQQKWTDWGLLDNIAWYIMKVLVMS